MKKRTGLYPAVRVDAAACGVVSQAGGVALLEAARVSGLDRLPSRAFEPWRAPRAVHDPGKVLLDLAVALALGGDCLADVAPAAAGRLRKVPVGDPVLDAGSAGPAAEPTGSGERDGRSATTARAPRPARSTSTAGEVKVGFYQDPDDTARARAAYDWTRPHEGHRSFSDFIAAAVMREVARLEAKHHDGQPWTAVEPGQLPTGKPLGS